VALVVVLVGGAVRLWTASKLGIFPNLDSWDYLQLAEEIRRGDWSVPALGERRMPGYPFFLAALRALAGTGSATVLIAQSFLGLLTALATARAITSLAGSVLGVAAGVAVAVHPVYLLFEHQPMAESLFLATLASCLSLAVSSVRRDFRATDAVLLGVVAAACVLSRPNGIAAIAILGVALVGLAVRRFVVRRSEDGAPFGRPPWRFAIAGLVGFAALVGPWLAFTKARFGELSFVPFHERNRIVYLALQEALDPALPGFAPLRPNRETWHPHAIYDVLWKISERGRGAEALARELFREQVAAHPERLAEARRVTVQVFVGGPAGPAALQDVRFWFDQLIRRQATLAPTLEGFQPFFDRHFPGGEDVRAGTGSNLWSSVTWLYLGTLRRFLIVGSVLLAIAALICRRESPGSDVRRWFLGTLLAAFLGTVMLHVANLAALDRFAAPFDLIAIAIASLAFADLGRVEAPAFAIDPPIAEAVRSGVSRNVP
jgi:4-amino-4-deoxy-L-arabinose transferase-like glycosyltransferase